MRLDHIEYLRGVSKYRAIGHPRHLPAERQHAIGKHKDLCELERRLNKLRIQETSGESSHQGTVDESDVDNVDDDASFAMKLTAKQIQVLKTRPHQSELAKYREEWVQRRVEAQVRAGGKAPETIVYNDVVHCLFKAQPDRQRIAKMMPMDDYLSYQDMLCVVESLLAYYTKDYDVFYHPGEEPVNGRCPVGNCNLTSLTCPMRSNYIQDCQRKEHCKMLGWHLKQGMNPARSLPGAVKQVFWRITLFYIVGLTFVGLLLRSDDNRLLGSGGLIDVKASPFVLIALDAGLHGYDSFMNVIILVSVLSIGVSGVYGASRTLTALAEQGYAPKFFTYVDRSGRPLMSVLLIIIFGLLAYVNLDASGEIVFAWLQALSGLAALFTWGSICLAHIRFRNAWKFHGHTLDEIPFKAVGGVYGSWLGLSLVILVLIAQFFVAIAPPKGGINDAEGFFQTYLALPVVLFFWVCGFLWKRAGWLRTEQIDVDSGRREIDWEPIHAERERLAAMPAWRRLLNIIF
ncbi:hypothetical protein RU639_010941 [Aspergillus parasiticus]